jgi:hypothetical protein
MGARHSAVASRRSSVSVAIFSLTLFVSAALLFLMEPMFANIIFRSARFLENLSFC